MFPASSSSRRTAAGLHAASMGLESLEPRVHLAAYTAESILNRFDVPGNLGQIAPPVDVTTVGFGLAAASVGDVDGDGFGDVAVAAPGRLDASPEGTIPGVVFLFSGRTGQEIWRVAGEAPEFGASLAAIGDQDSDGIADLLIGSPRSENSAGRVRLVSGATGDEIATWTGADPGGLFGSVVVAAAGVGGADFLVGAPGGGPDGQGSVLAFQTDAEEALFTLTGEAVGDRFGAALWVADVGVEEGEVGDGIPDILIGAPGNDAAGEDAGRAYLYNGADRALRLTLTGAEAGDAFGAAVAIVGRPDAARLLVGAPGRDLVVPGLSPAMDAGELYFFDASGEHPDPDSMARIVSITPDTGYGRRITPTGDIDGDGVGDFYVVAAERPVSNATPQLWSGATLTTLASAYRPVVGDVLIGVGDLDGDGFGDALEGFTVEERATLVSSLGLLPPREIHGGSDDLTFLFSSFATGARTRFAFIDGVLTPFADIPGIGTDAVIRGVNNDHVIVGQLFAPGQTQESDPAGEYIIVSGGVRTRLADAVTDVVGGVTPNLDDFTFVEIGNDGTILFNEHDGTLTIAGRRAWAFKDGVLTLLWTGTVSDVNDSGVIVGTRLGDFTQAAMMRDAGGQIAEVAGMASAESINNEGAIAGTTSDGDLAVWRDGEVTVISSVRNVSVSGVRISDGGAVGYTTTAFIGQPYTTATFIYTPQRGIQELRDVIFGPRLADDPRTLAPLKFASGGRALLHTGVLTPLDEEIAWGLGAGRPFAAVPTALGELVLGLNALGDAILYKRSGEAWTVSRVRNLDDASGATDIIGYTDPSNGGAYFFVVGLSTLRWGQVTPGSGELFFQPIFGADTIVADAAVFTTADGRVALAGTAADGDLILVYQRSVGGPVDVNIWSSSNLTEEHILARGQTFVPVAGNLTGFSAPWGADHLAYLDAAGQVHAVWWAPDSPLWRTDQLTFAAADGELNGRLTSFVTPWSTLHVNAFDAEGRTVAVWWAPGFGGDWRTDPLAPGAPTLEPASAASYATDWNALNIAGRDARTGHVVVYWWTPESGAWIAERIGTAQSPGGVAVTGRVAAIAGADGGVTLSIVGRAESGGEGETGHLVRLSWSIGDALWSSEDLTDLIL